MTSTTVAGTKLAISAAAPATEDSAGYGALTYTVVKGIEKIGAIGATIAEITFQPLDGPEEVHKGPPSYGSLQPSLAVDDADAGQTLLRTASEPGNNALYSVKVTLPSGAIRYSQGRVFGFPETIDTATTLLMANPTIRLSKKVVPVAAGG
ncbi:hypothetical protein [Rhizorhabdus histidinilytica]|uniref:hypothetical protein n=1 Tax=Rhizorhabdus histidinilytica TaxID=439228 RepID=UPI00321F9C56